MENNDLKKSGFITAAELRSKQIDLTVDDSDEWIDSDSVGDIGEMIQNCEICWGCGGCVYHCCMCEEPIIEINNASS